LNEEKAEGIEPQRFERETVVQRFGQRLTVEQRRDNLSATGAERIGWHAWRRCSVEQGRHQTKVVDPDPGAAAKRIDGEDSHSMSETSNPRREGRRTVTPFVSVEGEAEAVFERNDRRRAHGRRSQFRRGVDGEWPKRSGTS
jgi:hypothetical protein